MPLSCLLTILLCYCAFERSVFQYWRYHGCQLSMFLGESNMCRCIWRFTNRGIVSYAKNVFSFRSKIFDAYYNLILVFFRRNLICTKYQGRGDIALLNFFWGFPLVSKLNFFNIRLSIIIVLGIDYRWFEIIKPYAPLSLILLFVGNYLRKNIFEVSIRFVYVIYCRSLRIKTINWLVFK